PRRRGGRRGARGSTAAAAPRPRYQLQLRSTSHPPFAVPAAARRLVSLKQGSRRDAAASFGHDLSRRLCERRKIPTLLEQVRGHAVSIVACTHSCQIFRTASL